ncbi:hypothetical protein [Vibrio vulnificus]|uniref:hypothetical protein n=1 Tax=Vibrio vulnificus TaxID=672 RepID=UPI003ED9FB9B
MKINQFYANLRSQLKKVITGVQDADGLFWDNTTPNSSIRRELENLLANNLQLAAKHFGVYVVTRHSSCPNKHHNTNFDYPTSNNFGIDIEYGDARYKWTGYQLFQGERYCTCACSSKNKPTNHWVIDDFVYEKELKRNFDVDSLIIILGDIGDAIDSAGEKRPRSAIREWLLRAMLNINDQLLPIPMDDFVIKYVEN